MMEFREINGIFINSKNYFCADVSEIFLHLLIKALQQILL